MQRPIQRASLGTLIEEASVFSDCLSWKFTLVESALLNQPGWGRCGHKILEQDGLTRVRAGNALSGILVPMGIYETIVGKPLYSQAFVLSSWES